MKNYRKSKSISVLITVFAYVIAIFAAISIYRYTDGYTLISRLALADLGATLVIFLFSVLFNNSSMYDPYWSVKPIVIATFFFYGIRGLELSSFQWVFYFLVFLYGLRLTINFYRGWPGLVHEDWRYAGFREQFPSIYWLVSLFGVHIFPTIMVFLGCLPIIGASSATGPAYPVLSVTGLLILFFSILLAFVSDEQLRKYRVSRKGELRDQGLWKYSRHPNYLGEMMTWWGIFIFGLSYGTEFLWTGIGALAISLMFIFISIPLMEKRLIKRNGKYLDYRKSVPVLIPIKFGRKRN